MPPATMQGKRRAAMRAAFQPAEAHGMRKPKRTASICFSAILAAVYRPADLIGRQPCAADMPPASREVLRIFSAARFCHLQLSLLRGINGRRLHDELDEPLHGARGSRYRVISRPRLFQDIP